MSVVHLAGNRVVIGNYAVQRCLLCGEVMGEFNARNISTLDGRPPSQFFVGGFYEFGEDWITLIDETESPNFESDLEIPENCCIRARWDSD